MKEEISFIDELIAEAEAKEELQTLAYFDLIIAEIIRLEDEISQNFHNADEETAIIKQWSLTRNNALQEKSDFLKLKLENFIREEGKKTIDLPHGTLKIRKLPDKVEILDMEAFLQNANQDVVNVIPESIKPDLNKIKVYIRNSGRPLKGVTIIEGVEQFKLTLKSKENKNDNTTEA
ncbi:MAG: host-nuclease inhibitor Gam family protein [Ignavibacteriaceae bacterium]